MGMPVLCLGKSGSGKTTAIRNLDPKRTVICQVEKQRMPFRQKFPMVLKPASYTNIMQLFKEIAEKKRPDIKTIVIDDSQFLIVNEFFDRATEKGYDKFTSIALNFRNLIHWVNVGLPNDITVYFLHHTQMDEFGNTKAKTVGKLLDEKLTVEGCFDVVLMTERNQDGWWFRTVGSDSDPVKAPLEMFADELIPNDLAIVDKAIRDYYEMEETK